MKAKPKNENAPPIFAEGETRAVSPVADAKLRIHTQAKAMGIAITLDELERFALLLRADHFPENRETQAHQ